MTALEQIRHQNEVMKNIFAGKIIKGESVSTLLEEVIGIIEQYKLFERDTITGCIRSTPLATNNPKNIISQQEAENLFKTFFCDKLFVVNQRGNKSGDYDLRTTPLSFDQQKTIFQQALQYCTYNSREELFNSIPQWDGVKRIDTFMRDFFMCNTNPHFFWLFLVDVVGKLHNPENRVEHWYDFVGSAKGTGKTSFFTHLLGSIGCESMAIKGNFNRRSLEDFYTECYNANALIVNDDECTGVTSAESNKGISYDEFKSMTTANYDTFSRKFCQPETHARPFVIVRTSNHPKTVYSPNERRQIIFNIGLPEHTCLHWHVDNSYMAQLLAEAKAYYLQYGMYELTEEDKEDIYRQNIENTNFETTDYYDMEDFFYEVRKADGGKYEIALSSKVSDNYYWLGYKSFVDWWRIDHKQKPISSTQFWKQVLTMSKIRNTQVFFEDKVYKDENRSSVRAFGLKKRIIKPVVAEDDLSDIPF